MIRRYYLTGVIDMKSNDKKGCDSEAKKLVNQNIIRLKIVGKSKLIKKEV